jgi:hypothetical protein
MTERAKEIYRAWEDKWVETYKFPNHEELSLAAALREVVIEVILKYMQYAEWEIVNKIMEDINELADELEAL